MFAGHYDDWNMSRINTIVKYVKPEYIKNKQLLELGCGYAHIGNKFHELGALVTSSDARIEHLEVVKQLYPHINTIIIDGDKDSIPKHYDIIVHWGLLYHLNEIEYHLQQVLSKCDLLFLETEVLDSDNDSMYITTVEEGYDQAFNTYGIRPSQSYVEKIIKQNGFEYKLIKDSMLNTTLHNYDWDITNTNTWHHGLRRFWICWKTSSSPLVS